MTKFEKIKNGDGVSGVVPDQRIDWIGDHFHVPFYVSGTLFIRKPHFYQDVLQCNVRCLLERAKEAK